MFSGLKDLYPAKMKGLEDGSKLLQYVCFGGVVLESAEFFGEGMIATDFFPIWDGIL